MCSSDLSVIEKVLAARQNGTIGALQGIELEVLADLEFMAQENLENLLAAAQADESQLDEIARKIVEYRDAQDKKTMADKNKHFSDSLARRTIRTDWKEVFGHLGRGGFEPGNLANSIAGIIWYAYAYKDRSGTPTEEEIAEIINKFFNDPNERRAWFWVDALSEEEAESMIREIREASNGAANEADKKARLLAVTKKYEDKFSQVTPAPRTDGSKTMRQRIVEEAQKFNRLFREGVKDTGLKTQAMQPVETMGPKVTASKQGVWQEPPQLCEADAEVQQY